VQPKSHKSNAVPEFDMAEMERKCAELRERAWRAEAIADERWGLRREIAEELGIGDETGDEALRRGLEAIRELKRRARGCC
jgi:hypothetical protein